MEKKNIFSQTTGHVVNSKTQTLNPSLAATQHGGGGVDVVGSGGGGRVLGQSNRSYKIST